MPGTPEVMATMRALRERRAIVDWLMWIDHDSPNFSVYAQLLAKKIEDGAHWLYGQEYLQTINDNRPQRLE